MKTKREKTEQCSVCEKFFTSTGIINHVPACERKHEPKPEQETPIPEADPVIETPVPSPTPIPEATPQPVFSPPIPTSPEPQISPVEQTEAQSLTDITRENKLRRQIKESHKLDRDLAKDYAEEDPIDRLVKIQQLKSFSQLGGGDNQNQNQMLFQLQSQNFQAQLAMQQQLAQIQKDTQQQHVDFMKAELDRARKESGGTGELSKFKELAKEMDYSKTGESDMGKVADMVGSNVKYLPEIVAAIKGQGGKEALDKYAIEHGIPQPPKYQPNQMPPEAPGVATPTPSANPGPVNPEMSDREIEDYARKNYLIETADDDILNQNLGIGKFKRIPSKK